MTALASLLFIAMIHIDCKITNFPLHFFLNDFLVTIIMLVKSLTSLQKKE